MLTPDTPKPTDAALQLDELKQQLSNAEKEYEAALNRDQEFDVLKKLKNKIKDLKGKIRSCPGASEDEKPAT